jgi:hypothetical protein
MMSEEKELVIPQDLKDMYEYAAVGQFRESYADCDVVQLIERIARLEGEVARLRRDGDRSFSMIEALVTASATCADCTLRRLMHAIGKAEETKEKP